MGKGGSMESFSAGNPSTNQLSEWGIGLAGMAVGAVAGHLIVEALLRYGVYAAVIPGAIVGLGAGYFRRTYNKWIGILAAVTGLATGIYTELDVFTFGDGTLLFFLTHPQPVTWLMLALGTWMAFSWGAGRNR